MYGNINRVLSNFTAPSVTQTPQSFAIYSALDNLKTAGSYLGTFVKIKYLGYIKYYGNTVT